LLQSEDFIKASMAVSTKDKKNYIFKTIIKCFSKLNVKLYFGHESIALIQNCIDTVYLKLTTPMGTIKYLA